MKPLIRNSVLVLAAFAGAFLLFSHKQPGPKPAQLPAEPPPLFETRCAKQCLETFEAASLPESHWSADAPEDTSAFSDNGSFFRNQNPKFQPPAAFRLTTPLGSDGFLALESYSRTQKQPKQLFAIVEDPSAPGNHALRISSPEHTDGTLLRTTRALGDSYHICAKVGFIDFGTGDGANGYNGQETNGPWSQDNGDARNENGCYFSAIYNALPRPHNNALAHYERLAFIDSDNNTEGWTKIWDAAAGRWFRSGWHPVMIGAAAGEAAGENANGPPFRSWAAGGWNRPGELLAADAYKENSWYTVCMIRAGNRFTMRISGNFRYGGQTAYEAVLEDAGEIFQEGQPQYWLLGDPHINYYEGSLLVDDVSLTVP